MRTLWAVVAAAAAAAVGGAILGEYTLGGGWPVVAGALYGVVVSEVLLVAQRRPAPALVAAATAMTVAGAVWALWISTGHQLGYARAVEWAGVAVAGATVAAWAGTAGRVADRRAGRRRRP